MIQKRLITYIFATCLLLAGCTSEDDFEGGASIDETTEAVITINGGRPGGSVGATRSVNQPALPGICRADKMQIWVYFNAKYAWGDINELTYKETIVKDITNTNQADNGSVDRWVKHGYSYTSSAATGNHFAMPALAYTSADESLFSVSYTGRYIDLSLTLTGTQTPELFFGRTKFTHAVNPGGSYFDNEKWLDEGRNYYYQYGITSRSYSNAPMSGHLYRIVSQINVGITEVPTELVDHLELYMTNVPNRLTLYGTHGNIYGSDDIGRFYPVTAVTSTTNCIDGNTLVATTNDFTGDEAHMSAFFLPSEVGGELMLRVYYKPDAVKDALGNDVLQRDYPIHPGKSAFLTGDDADVYNVSSALQNGSDLYVYNATSHKFFSYANVRVNIAGKYENVATEDQDVTVTLEVEPGYEREHTITIN